MRALIALLLLVSATTASAQAAKAPPAKAPASKAPTTKAAAPQGAARGTGRPGLDVAPAQERPRTPTILREVFRYDAEGRRDPFFTLLASAELRPTISDLKLIGILYDPSGRRSVVTLRDLTTNERYQVTTGTTLGRMKVVLIKPKTVIFQIEEFGLNRQDSLFLGDTTKARAR